MTLTHLFDRQVSYNLTENIASLIKIELDNVPIDKLEVARDEARKCLVAVRSGEEPVDMERMKRLLKKQLRESLASLEADPHHAVAFRCIGDALYSQNEKDVSLPSLLSNMLDKKGRICSKYGVCY